ncbi:hypothetical protein [Paraburkholderia dilworthii]|uniref:hypothetical protein n=1 Tax=Paraburkholderia dilworthii TaxID=948106 RepID=UPI001267EB69|nr:hypothetical protein [Paraburkholderia dilworthii]
MAIAGSLLTASTQRELVTSVLENQINGFSDGKMAVTKECHIRYLEPTIPELIKSQVNFNSICFEVNADQKKDSFPSGMVALTTAFKKIGLPTMKVVIGNYSLR